MVDKIERKFKPQKAGILLLACFFAVVPGLAQTTTAPAFNSAMEWEVTSSPLSFTEVATDNDGNVLLTGTFTGSLAFGGQTLTSTYANSQFLAKLDAAQNLIWLKALDGNSAGNGIAADASGNIFITGFIVGQVTFPGPGNITLSQPAAAYLAKLDGDGDTLWAVAKTSSSYGINVVVDNSTVYLKSLDFFTLPSNETRHDTVLGAYSSSNGSLLWEHNAISRDPITGYLLNDMSVDAQGNVIVAGFYKGMLDDLYPGGTGNSGFLTKYTATGQRLWTRTLIGNGNNYFHGVSTYDNRIYVTGHFIGTVDFGGQSLSTPTTGDGDIYVACYSTDNQLLWLKQAGGIITDLGSSIEAGPNGIVVSGRFGREVNLFGTQVTSHGNPSAERDLFVAKLDLIGNPVWIKTAGGSLNDYAERIAVAPDDTVWVTGTFQSTSVDFDGIQLSNPTTTRAYLAALGTRFTVTPPGGLITTETGGSASFTVNINGVPSSDVTLELTVSDPNEGQVSPQFLTFPANQASQPKQVLVVGRDDSYQDGDIAYTVNFATVVSADSLFDGIQLAPVNLTNLDDDSPAWSAIDVTYLEDKNPATAPMVVTRSGDAALALSASWQVMGGTATADEDYVLASGTLNWAAGQTGDRSFSLSLLDDSLIEGDETVLIEIIDNAGNLNPLTLTLTLQDSEGPPIISIDDAEAAENTGHITFNVTLNHPADTDVTVDYEVAAGGSHPAQLITEVEQAFGTITFTGNTASIPVSIAIFDDANCENDETFKLILSNPSANAAIADREGLGTITDNDNPKVSFSGSASVSPFETDGHLTVKVSLTAGSCDQPVTVDVRCIPGTAVRGENYNFVDKTLVFLPGQSDQDLTINLIHDADCLDQTLELRLVNPEFASLGQNTVKTVTIKDKDKNCP